MTKTILRNAKIWTGDPARPLVRAVGISGERIVAAGDGAAVRAVVGRADAEWDLGGRLVTPGFVDSHVHLLGGGEYLLGLDLRGAKGPEDLSRLVREAVAKTPPGAWVIGGRWDNTSWPGGLLPDRKLLDAFSPDTPIFIRRTDGHMGLANACALRIGGIGPSTPAPAGGAIDRDAQGEPTGILRDAGMARVEAHITPPPEPAKERMARAALRHAASLGVTAMSDMASPGALPIYRRLREKGELTCRIAYYGGLSERERVRLSPVAEDWVRVAGVKAFVDGSLGARTALMFEPFLDAPETRGLMMHSEEELRRDLIAADLAGLQPAVHAIGDRANAIAIETARELIRANGPRDRRMRIEHAQHLRAEDFPRFSTLGVIASVQPAHILLDVPCIRRALDDARAARTYAFRSLLDAGAHVAFGTDWPVVLLNPMETLYAAVTRRPLDGSWPDGWTPEQRLTVEDALRCATAEGAYAQFAESRRGVIRPGMLADLVVLSDDLLSMEPLRIRDVRVDMTMVGGQVVYSRDAAGLPT